MIERGVVAVAGAKVQAWVQAGVQETIHHNLIQARSLMRHSEDVVD